MGKILNVEEGEHLVQKYVFSNLDLDGNDDDFKEIKVTEPNTQVLTEKKESLDSASLELIEKLVSRTDEFSNSIARLEQQLQNQTKECDEKLGHIKETSYQAGYNEGYNKAKQELEASIKEHLSKLVEGVHKIEEVYKEYQHKAENIEKELVGVAIDISEEVIAKEVSKASKEIALNLTKELLNDIKEATKIEIRLNPLDFDYVQNNLNLDKIKIIPDNAVSAGGVVINSDAGNIEAEIHERFNTIKNHLKKG